MKWEQYPEPKAEYEHYLPNNSYNSDESSGINTDLEGDLSLPQTTNSKNMWSKQGYAGKSRFSESERPVYTQFPVRSKYSSKTPKSTTTKKQSPATSSKNNNNKEKEEKKISRKQARKQREAAALLGITPTKFNKS